MSGIQAIMWERYMEEKVPVYIFRTNKLQDELYAVAYSPYGEAELNNSFWLNAYTNVGSARKFCKRHNLPVMGVIK